MPRRRLPSSIAVAAVFTCCAGLMVTAALFATVWRLEYDKMALGFAQDTALRVGALRKGLDDLTEVLTVTNQMFNSAGPVSRKQFASFTAPLLRRYPYIVAFSFQRRVGDAERPAFEAAMKAAFPGFYIADLDHGRREPAPRRPDYLVIDYLEPLAGNELAFGVDASQLEGMAAALRQAAAHGGIAATAMRTLVQEADRQRGMVVLMPVSAGAAANGAGPAAAPLGYTAMVIRLTDLVGRIMRNADLLDAAQLSLEVYAGAEAAPGQLIYQHGAPGDAPGWRWRLLEPPTAFSETLEAFGRPWQVRMRAGPRAFLDVHLGSLSTLLGGILFSLLSAFLVQSQAQRSRRVQWLVDQRTADLKHSNAQLSQDIAARQRTERALQASEQRFRRLLALSSDWYWEQDAQLRFTSISGGFFDKGAMAMERFIGLRRWDMHPEISHSAAGREHIATLQAQRPFSNFEYATINKRGETRWISINGEPLFDSKGEFKGYRGTGADITVRKLAEQQIQHVAHHDVLTGLPNRALLQDRLSQAIAYSNRSGEPLWVMLIDLDRFKFVNDSMGHKAGDLLLTTISARLLAGLRENDTVARLSGDEFVALLSQHPDEPLGANIVRRLMDTIAQPVDLDGKEFFVTCSIGVAVYEANSPAQHKLIEQADIAMYNAKKLGRNNFQFYVPSMNAAALERLSIESALRSALERDEFVLYYQPQLDLTSGAIVGMEALLRWRHPELGLVQPERFIGLAEETGLIVPIGSWVLSTACAQAQAWLAAGLGPLTIAVNLSARQFGEANLVRQIAAVLEATGLPPASLDLELTESLFMTDIGVAIQQMQDVKTLGVKLSMDDFGTGYSSFSYLRRFPIDVLKIDRAFINDISSDTSAAPIVASIITLAHNLKLRVIAEGVETEEQLSYLRRHGCDELQGYYLSEPVPAAQFEELLRSGRHLLLPPLEPVVHFDI